MKAKRKKHDKSDSSESSAQEFFDSGQLDDEIERMQFQEMIERLKLPPYLDSEEINLLFDIWTVAEECNFLRYVLRKPELPVVNLIDFCACSRQEQILIKLFRKLS